MTKKTFEIKRVETIYTGGNIYVFLGALQNGTFFMAESSCFDVRILNTDPSTVEDEDGENPIWFEEWQQEHLVKDLSESECPDFFVEMLTWVMINDSDSYDSDLEYFMKEAKEFQGTTGWR